MKKFEDFKNECYLKNPQISLQTIEILYKVYIVNNNNLHNSDEKTKTKKTTKK